jgi:hypothetical protein
MVARAEIQAGICGFRASVEATANRGRLVSFTVETDCETVAALAAALGGHGDFDAFDEIDPRTGGSLMPLVRANLHGCCAGCAVPVGLFKAMQVAAGLALPKDIEIALSLDRGAQRRERGSAGS